MTYTFTSVIFFDLINEGSKRDSKSAAARGEKNGEHSQILSCAIAEKLSVKNKKTSQPDFLILQVKKNEIYYEGPVFCLHSGRHKFGKNLSEGRQELNFYLFSEYDEDLNSVEPDGIALSS